MVARGYLAEFLLSPVVMLFFVIYLPFSPWTIDGVFCKLIKCFDWARPCLSVKQKSPESRKIRVARTKFSLPDECRRPY